MIVALYRTSRPKDRFLPTETRELIDSSVVVLFEAETAVVFIISRRHNKCPHSAAAVLSVLLINIFGGTSSFDRMPLPFYYSKR